MRTCLRLVCCALCVVTLARSGFAQPAFPQSSLTSPASAEDTKKIQAGLAALQQDIAALTAKQPNARLLADVEVFAKGVEWCLRHGEFYLPKNTKAPASTTSAYVKHCLDAIEQGQARAKELATGKASWATQTGVTIRGYVSRVEGSVQPYALTLPPQFAEAKSTHRWPLHVVLHGRGGDRNEVRFFVEHAKRKPAEGQNWIQLDVFGRTDNAYRWAGETDVLEALTDVQRRFRIDDRRITLWGFSMGGAGSWSLGLHHPSLWSSVGPGAGFVDFYNYQKQTEKLPAYQDKPLRIYDSIRYAMNLANVPLCTYGGELDPQLAASTLMVDEAKKLEVPVKLLIGPKTEHRFHPDSFQEFMTFHKEKSQTGRAPFPGAKAIQFVTYTLKYNRCEWLTIEELDEQYEQTVVEGGLDASGTLLLETRNVAALQISRDIADDIEIDEQKFPLRIAADNLLPGVYFRKENGKWEALSYQESVDFAKNTEIKKRHNLQGPIDDAFMEPFVCVTGSGTPWVAEQQAWADWTLARFQREFDKWLRGKVPVITDKQLTDEHIADKNVILFGDPGSNSVLAKVIEGLPIEWTKSGLEVNGQKYNPATHGVCLIYPNPLNPSRYVVINSGHTIHEKDFRASNAWLFPKLGDIAVVKFEKEAQAGFVESTVWADLFDNEWTLSTKKK